MLWLNAINVIMTYCEVPQSKKVDCTSAHLNDASLIAFMDWRNSVSVADLHDWSAFSSMMKFRFLPLDHLINIRKQMVSIKQSTTVTAYNLAFEKLLSQIPPSDRESEGFIVMLYLNGLQTHVREIIQYFLLPTVKENMTRALLYDSSHFGTFKFCTNLFGRLANSFRNFE
jgi:hypothetical protein